MPDLNPLRNNIINYKLLNNMEKFDVSVILPGLPVLHWPRISFNAFLEGTFVFIDWDWDWEMVAEDKDGKEKDEEDEEDEKDEDIFFLF